jgi:hypothetical protein
MIFFNKRVAELLAVMLGCLVATSALAESVVTEWTNPGSFPFRGDYSDVCSLYAEELSEEQCARALLAFEKDTCEVYSLKDGDVIDVSFTSDRHYRKVLQVAFGDHIAPDDPLRNALVCDTGRTDGLKLVRPDVCGNWSLMTLREPAPPVVVVKQNPEPAFRCWLEARHSHGPGGEIIFLPGIETDICTERHYIPGILFEGSGLYSQGRGEVCDWVNR